MYEKRVNDSLFARKAAGVWHRRRRGKHTVPARRGMQASNPSYITIDDSDGIGIPQWSKLVLAEIDDTHKMALVWWQTGIGGHYVWIDLKRLITFEEVDFFRGVGQ